MNQEVVYSHSRAGRTQEEKITCFVQDVTAPSVHCVHETGQPSDHHSVLKKGKQVNAQTYQD